MLLILYYKKKGEGKNEGEKKKKSIPRIKG